MKLTRLRVQNVRAHGDFSIDLSPDVNLITGLNGSGKTSLLEAVYITLQGSSFKSSDRDVIRKNSPWYRIDVDFDDDSSRVVKFDPSRPTGKKQYEINHKTFYRLSYENKYPVVLFEPDELRLISGSPTRRRQFIDRLISQIDPEYSLSLRRYERALKQRNTLLKQNQINSDNLFIWDVALSKYGAYLINKRHDIIKLINDHLGRVYKEISNRDDKVDIKYNGSHSHQSEQSILTALSSNTRRDQLLGFTSIGPHRHDIEFEFNGQPAASSASRGEIRTIILALKFIDVDIIKNYTEKPPIILLDDVFSELDETRQQHLTSRFSSYQTIITSVSADLPNYHEVRL